MASKTTPKATPPKLVPRPKTAAERTARVRKILKILDEMYPHPTVPLHHRDCWELLVATILSAQCTDKRVNMVTPVLFKKYKTAKDFANVAQEELEKDIQSTGFYRNKAKSVRGAAAAIVAEHHGEVPQTMDELTALPGVGRKTANVVLGNAFGKNEGVVVDTHVSRLSQRLGLTKQTTPEKIEADLVKLIPRAQWTDFSHWLIWHGRRRCFARKPDCVACEIQALCPSAFKA